MRAFFLGGAAAVLAVVPQFSSAQVYLSTTPAPEVTAARAAWQLSGEPLFYKGSFYYPAGPTEFFDERAMARTGTYEGVPLYEISTLEPYAIVFVPIGGRLMRPYERRREGDLAGTVGSRMPSFPIARDGEVASTIEDQGRYRRRVAINRAQWDWPEPTAAQDPPPLASLLSGGPPRPSTSPTIREVPRRESTNAGPFLAFRGARYYSSGKAVSHQPQRFTPVGMLEGVAVLVFRELNGDDRTIFVEVVAGGPLAPYTRK